MDRKYQPRVSRFLTKKPIRYNGSWFGLQFRRLFKLNEVADTPYVLKRR